MDESAAIKSSEEEEPMPASSSSPQQYDEKYSQSLIDQEALLLTQLPPPSANNDDTLFFCNTQSSSMMPYSESQCSQQQQLLMLATQHPTTNDFNGNDSDEGDEDSLMQTQFFGSCNDLDENYHDGAQVSSQQPLLTTAAQPTITKINTRIADDYDVIMGSTAQQPSGTQLGHDISMTQHGYYIDKLSKQYLDNGEHYENNNDDNNNSDMLSFPTLEQRPTTTNEQELEFLYYTQLKQQQQQQHGEGNDENKCEEDYYDDDSNHDNDDDLERIVEEQNLAVSLSMEVIESVEKNGSQTSSSIENKKEEPECLLRNKDEAKLESIGDDDTNDEDNNYGGYEHHVEQHSTGSAVMPSSAFGFVNAGSGKEITVNDEEMARATEMLAEDGDTNIIVAKFDEHKVEQRLSGAAVMPSPAFGFVSAGSGKAITVTDEEMAKAAKIVVDDVDKYNDTTPASVSALVVTTKMTSKINQQSQEEKLSTVMNPYAKKRSLDQISKGGIGNPAAVTSSTASLASTQSRKFVINPYTKTAQKPKSVVRNPYAKVPNETSTTAGLSSVIPPAPKGGIITNPIQSLDKVSNNKTGKSFFDVSSVKLPKPKAEISFRLKGISFSLPLAERLPSRNVSYKPAEILTVSELYQYLYGANATTANCFKEMQSVRITGTLLCVSTSTSDENDGSKGDLYSTGTFLLIGDPLEKNRFPTKPLPPTQQHSSSHSTNGNISIPHTAATKSRPTSILKNKHTPILRTSQSALASITTGQPTTTTPAADGSTQPHESNTATKNPILRGGLLNNNNPKKFVYNGSKNRSSFGGGLHRKFVTPKRVATLTATNTGSSIMRKLSLVKSVSVSRGSSDVKIETIIQRHPAPLVPVWIGSSLDDDGLDDSVVNDFVMVMGEIVVEHCSSCQERIENGAVGANEADPDVGSKSIKEDEDEGAENDGLPSSNEENLQAAVIRSVRDAALSIAACTWRNADSRSQSTQQEIEGRAKKKQFCSNCVCFLSARIVKNANGTDMNLQKESLKVRREYFKRRKEQMEGLLQGMLTNHVFSVGCGPYF